MLEDYRVHPEPKSAAYDGLPCDQDTVGLLARRHARLTLLRYIGKESNKLEEVEAGLIHDWDDVLSAWDDPSVDLWAAYVAPVIQRIPMERLVSEAGLSERHLRRLRNQHGQPSDDSRSTLARVAAAFAREYLTVPPHDDVSACRMYLDTVQVTQDTRSCPMCGQTFTPKNLRARYCSDRCRARAARRRKAIDD